MYQKKYNKEKKYDLKNLILSNIKFFFIIYNFIKDQKIKKIK